MEVTMNVTNYIEAINWVLDNNPVYDEDEEEARKTLDGLIKEAFTTGGMLSSGGFTVYCSDYSNDETSAYCEILVKPGLCKEGHYFQMVLNEEELKLKI